MRHHAGIALSLFSATLCTTTSCIDNPVGPLCLDGCATEISNIHAYVNNRDVDILFVIDNSTSMTVLQRALADAIPRFIQKIDSLNIDYHVGVVSTDVGALPAPGASFGAQLGTACESYAGGDGRLVRRPCTENSFYTEEGRKACQSLCPDPKFVPGFGQGYISKVKGISNVPKDMVLGMDLGPQRAFQCLALLGDTGCGLEAPLESAWRALDGHHPDNNGFLRDHSLLTVVFITDEDDCSVKLSRRNENDPMPLTCTPGSQDPAFGCFNPDYRCFAKSVSCAQGLDTEGAKNKCVERSDSYLEPTSKYSKLLRGLRRPNRLLVSGIWSPSEKQGGKVEIIQKDPQRGTWGLNRGEGKGTAACLSSSHPGVFGKAQVRLSNFASQIPGSLEISICEVDKYPDALSRVAVEIGQLVEKTCLPMVPALKDGEPVCRVGDVDANTPQAVPEESFPVCSSSCCTAWAASTKPTMEDPQIQQACMSQKTTCYCALPSTAGACEPGEAILGVWRKGGTEVPSGKVTNVRCASQR